MFPDLSSHLIYSNASPSLNTNHRTFISQEPFKQHHLVVINNLLFICRLIVTYRVFLKIWEDFLRLLQEKPYNAKFLFGAILKFW